MSKRTPEEQRLLASLDILEKGGDALQNAPHDGGFATEGTNIQSKAKAMKKALRALMKGGMSRGDAENMLKALSDQDDASSDASSDVDKSVKKSEGDDDSMSSDDDSGAGDDESADESGDESSSDDEKPKGKPFGKSRGASQLANASSSIGRQRESNIRKALVDENPEAEAAFDAAPILAKLVDSIDQLAEGSRSPRERKLMKSMRKSIDDFGSAQRAFNSKVAKALVMIVGRVDESYDLVKAMHDTPVPNARGTSLRKSDVREPAFGNGDTTGIDGSTPQSPLHDLSFLTVQEALVDMCMKGGANIDDITQFENSKGDFSKLPNAVVRQLEKRLCPAS